MNIVDFELFEVPPRWLFLKITTSDGTGGWGEPTVPGRLKPVRSAIELLMENYLLGESALPIAKHWETCYRGDYYRGGPILMSAISGIDQALWDIKGKHFDVPVYELLGGPVRDKMRVYQWIGGNDPEDVGEMAERMVEHGFKVLKMNGCGKMDRLATTAAIELATSRLEEVRERIGPDVAVGVDFHGRVSKSMASRVMRALEPYDPIFAEEPVLPEQNDYVPELAAQTSIPLSTGERLYSRWDFKDVLVRGGVKVLQPDISKTGGISEMMAIATLAEAFDVVLVPHCPIGPIALAASLQVDFAASNCVIQEQSIGVFQSEPSTALKYLDSEDGFSFEDGFIHAPEEPGLGISPDEDFVREQAQYEVNWNDPLWHHEDGSVAEW